MNKEKKYSGEKDVLLILDKNFIPAIIENQKYIKAVKESGSGAPLVIAIENSDGIISTFETMVFNDNLNKSKINNFYIERLVKTLLWSRGGCKITIGGSKSIGNHIKDIYSIGGVREFDAKFMSNIYEKPFKVESVSNLEINPTREQTNKISYNLKGNRIGFDLGASDRKVSAVINGKVVFSEEVVWNPAKQNDPCYHYHEIMSMLHRAAAYMPCVQAIGGSSAGIYINNRVMSASIFRAISPDLFESKVKNYLRELIDGNVN